MGAAERTRKWALAKALPKIYGDKIEVENKHMDGQGQPIDIVDLAALVLVRRPLKLL